MTYNAAWLNTVLNCVSILIFQTQAAAENFAAAQRGLKAAVSSGGPFTGEVTAQITASGVQGMDCITSMRM
jgi:hypothetical protein